MTLSLVVRLRTPRSLIAFVAALAIGACQAGDLDTPTSPETVTATAPGGNGKGKGGGGDGGDGGDGGGGPTVEGVPLTWTGAAVGNVSFNYAAGDYAVGLSEGGFGCAVVYQISTGTLSCLEIPGSGDGLVYPHVVNASGRIVGTYYRLDEQSSRGGYNIEHAFVWDWADGLGPVDIVPPAPFNEAQIACCTSLRSLDAEGRVLVEFSQWEREGFEGGVRVQEAVALVSADLQTRSFPTGVSTDRARAVGLIDGGTAILDSDRAYYVWSGTDGDAVVPLIGTDGQNGARARGVTDDGRVYGVGPQGTALVWPSPFQEPVVVSDLTVDFALRHTADGQLLIENSRFNANGIDFCIGANGTTALVPPPDLTSAQVTTGTQGLVFGWGYLEEKVRGTVTRTRTDLVWDVSQAGGC